MRFKKLTLALFIVFILPIHNFSQTQLGTDIVGETVEDQFGQAGQIKWRRAWAPPRR